MQYQKPQVMKLGTVAAIRGQHHTGWADWRWGARHH